VRYAGTRLVVLAALLLNLVPLSAPAARVAAHTDSLITSLVLNQAEAEALGLEFTSIDDTSSASAYVTARYIDSSLGYGINLTVTLSPCSSTDGIGLAGMTSGCTNCSEPNCQERQLANGDRMPNGPCFSAYRNGYTNFGYTTGETVFAQGDLLVRIESSKKPSGLKSLQEYQAALSRHNWFVQQVAAKLDALYQADMMQLTAYAYVAPQSSGGLAGRDAVVLEGTLTGPAGGVAGATLEGSYFSPSGSGWNYAATTDASGGFSAVIGPADEVTRITVKARHTDTSPAYAGTVPIVITDFGGQPAAAATGMTVSLATDKAAYAAGDTVVIRGSVAGPLGGLPDATVVVNVNGTIVTATLEPTGNFEFTHVLSTGISDGTYTITALVSHASHPDVNKAVTFVVGDLGMVLEQNPVTGKPFVGVAADGVSSVRIVVSLPGCTEVKAVKPAIGELKGESVSSTGAIALDSAGQAQLTYHPPDYLAKDQLGKSIDVHQPGSVAHAASVPLAVTYRDASGTAGQLAGEILVCRPPVMLVHGFVGSTTTWGKLSTYLRGEGFDTFSGDYSSTTLSIEGLSGLLQAHVQQQKLDYASANIKLAKVDAVGHSMGGLISRYYANGLPGYTGDLRKLIMVGTPNHGVSTSSKKIGDWASQWYGTHSVPAGQLYCESPFMQALNGGESTGAHLNPDVQYGNIYGLPDDWVVSAASAYLNGVNYVLQSDVKHSADIPGIPSVAITEYLDTWEQVRDWLTEDIYRPQLKGTRAEIVKHWGEVYVVDHDASGSHESKIASSPAGIQPFQSIRTGSNSRAIVHLSIDDLPWGVIFLDADSEMTLGYCSPQLVEVRLWQGSAAFRSKKDGHFSVPVQINKSTAGEWWKSTSHVVVRGLETEFAISMGNGIRVDCIEGTLAVNDVNASSNDTLVSGGQSVDVSGATVNAASAASRDDFWWSSEDDGFLDDGWGGGILARLTQIVQSVTDWFKALLARL
jgi:triacylglycerol lipase